LRHAVEAPLRHRMSLRTPTPPRRRNEMTTSNTHRLDSSAVGLAATGWISLLDRKTHLTMLVAPFSSLDRLVRAIPIVGYIIGGTLTSVPIGVSGDIRDPRVVPLGPRAIGSELAGIFTRIFKLPGKLLAPSSTSQEPEPSPAEE